MTLQNYLLKIIAQLQLHAIKEPEKTGGLLARSNNMSKKSDGLDYNNPAVRVAKQMQVIRKYRGEVNGDA